MFSDHYDIPENEQKKKLSFREQAWKRQFEVYASTLKP